MCLLMLYAAFQASIIAFPHVHILQDKRLVHSHPYSDNHHSHSEAQLLTLAHLSTFQGLEAPHVSVGEVLLPALFELEFGSLTGRASAAHPDSIRLRGPPFC